MRQLEVSMEVDASEVRRWAERVAAAQAELAARQLPGVPVWAIDADGLIVRPGPRLVDGVAALASVLHPARFPPHPMAASRRIA